MRPLLLHALLLAGCSTSAVVPGELDHHQLSAGAVPGTFIDSELGRWPSDALEFRDIRIAGDTLIAEVSHAGGCAEHGFALVFSPVFMESRPVQVSGLLSHDARGDNCRALIMRTLRFDLTPLKQVYREAYRVESDLVVLRGNWPGSLRYAF
jgi:hypothetical protein